MKKIILEPGNPLDLKLEKLKSLISELQEQDPEYNIQFVSTELTGYGVTFWEVLYVWLLWVGIKTAEAAIPKIVDLFIKWAHNRFHQEGGEKRPKYVAIYGPNGEVLKSVLVRSKDSEPEDRTEEDRKRPPRKLPRIE